MKLNERSVAHYATCDSPPDKTGFLFKKGERNTAYHRRWFVLKGNMLFYFEERDSREPIGVIVLEGCTVELCESAEEFAFAIKFDCAKARVYKMAAESQAAMESWVKALSRASFDYMRLVVKELESIQDEVQLISGCSKENGVAWSKPPAALANGFAEGGSSCVAWEGCADSGNGIMIGYGADGVRAPPVPPRRRGASLESPVSPGTGCFSKLHDWYGREVEELRVQWLQTVHNCCELLA
uniref:Sesquipedalian n=1 Tax=Lates calcarifer TaxID=8187 RepID=A0A4W6CI24_LATCA